MIRVEPGGSDALQIHYTFRGGLGARVHHGTRSDRRVAMCAHHILAALVAALLLGIGLRGTLRQGLAYLLANARRANPERDHRTGRLRVGLGLVEAA